MSRVENSSLLAAGLDLMELSGRPLTKISTGNRSMLYRLPEGETVRVRTCNDHVLVVIATPAPDDIALNVDGTDFILFVVPKIERTKGEVEAFLLPTAAVVRAVRTAYAQSLTGVRNRDTSTTCNLWLGNGPDNASNFRTHWNEYRLTGNSSARALPRESLVDQSPLKMSLGETIEVAKRHIAEAAGVSADRVKITVEVLF